MSMVATKGPSEAVTQQAPATSFGGQLKEKEGQFRAALPAHIPTERFMRVVLTAIQNNPKLAHADRASLWTSSIKAAQDGLLPDGREGALVIYRTKGKDESGRDVWIEAVQWMPMIAGIRKKVRNSGEIATWDAQVVHQKDQFEYELGDDPFIKHRPSLEPEPGPIIAVYSVATLKTGEKSREVMTISQVEKVRSRSKQRDQQGNATGPWKTDYEEMCRKTVARRHSKVLPMSTDLDDLIRRDDALYDMQGARDEAKLLSGGRPQSLSGQLDALAAGTGDAPQPRETEDPQTQETESKVVDHGPETGEGAPAVEDATETEAEPSADPRETVLAELRSAIMSGDRRVAALLNDLPAERRALVTDADVKELKEAQRTIEAQRNGGGR